MAQIKGHRFHRFIIREPWDCSIWPLDFHVHDALLSLQASPGHQVLLYPNQPQPNVSPQPPHPTDVYVIPVGPPGTYPAPAAPRQREEPLSREEETIAKKALGTGFSWTYQSANPVSCLVEFHTKTRKQNGRWNNRTDAGRRFTSRVGIREFWIRAFDQFSQTFVWKFLDGVGGVPLWVDSKTSKWCSTQKTTTAAHSGTKNSFAEETVCFSKNFFGEDVTVVLFEWLSEDVERHPCPRNSTPGSFLACQWENSPHGTKRPSVLLSSWNRMAVSVFVFVNSVRLMFDCLSKLSVPLQELPPPAPWFVTWAPGSGGENIITVATHDTNSDNGEDRTIIWEYGSRFWNL